MLALQVGLASAAGMYLFGQAMVCTMVQLGWPAACALQLRGLQDDYVWLSMFGTKPQPLGAFGGMQDS
jgi:hypothetical protein